MKLLTSALLVGAANAATMCTGATTNLISATCTATGMTITVDETCRSASYSWINFKDATFVDGNIATVEMPTTPGTTCVPDGSGADWTYTFLFTECNVGLAVLDSTADTQGIKWWTYSVYLNYDRAITTGTGNIQQLDQTLVQCRVPYNLQENAVATAIVVDDTADLVPDQLDDVLLWSALQLDVLKGGSAATAVYTTALATGAGATIGLGEHVKLEVTSSTLNLATDYNVAIKDCWASTVENIRDGNTDNADDDSGEIEWDNTGAAVNNGVATPHETVKFYEGMCPKYNWVTSFADHTAIEANTAIELRQFMFNAATSGQFFYHCEVVVCLVGTTSPQTDCVPDPDCATNHPLTNADNAPTGRRRRAILTKRIITRRDGDDEGDAGVETGPISVDPSTCQNGAVLEDDVWICLTPGPKSNAETAALSVLTGLLVCALH